MTDPTLPVPPHVRRPRVAAVAELAWDVIEISSPMLKSRDRAALFTTLGAGDHVGAIREGLRVMAIAHTPLPADLSARLVAWLDYCTGSPDEPGLRRLTASCSSPLNDESHETHPPPEEPPQLATRQMVRDYPLPMVDSADYQKD
ncbi:hypothetical protein HG717_33780 [Rhodococcus erythropolis]|uniref:hypothetical protein n=1 Tax=Rhodococcus erythropolis TaxID=1833 RepID=UPI001C9A63A9|nr:hypothetical protein [Rhodococcus erythropolis]MBY6388843.1 hypothetical protein [Rhodococcus erythropolis]